MYSVPKLGQYKFFHPRYNIHIHTCTCIHVHVSSNILYILIFDSIAINFFHSCMFTLEPITTGTVCTCTRTCYPSRSVTIKLS